MILPTCSGAGRLQSKRNLGSIFGAEKMAAPRPNLPGENLAATFTNLSVCVRLGALPGSFTGGVQLGAG